MLVGQSKQLSEVRSQLERYAKTSANILITGETGTGKELAARLIHELSGRRGLFVPVDCGSIPAALTETILYGHERGSYTGAATSSNGLFTMSNHGTLFLDEITNTSLSFQACLLRSLQERTVRRVGSNYEAQLDLRVVSATNKPLHHAIKNGLFRDDVYYRIGTLELTMPPLRDRPEDINTIALHVLDRLNQEHQRNTTISPDALYQLAEYSFPGNVRELENLITRAYHDTTAGEIRHVVVPLNSHHQPRTPQGLPVSDFWTEIATPYHEHELTRSDVKLVLHKALSSSRGRYKQALPLLGVEEAEYKRFMDYLRRNQLLLDHQHYRKAP